MLAAVELSLLGRSQRRWVQWRAALPFLSARPVEWAAGDGGRVETRQRARIGCGKAAAAERRADTTAGRGALQSGGRLCGCGVAAESV